MFFYCLLCNHTFQTNPNKYVLTYFNDNDLIDNDLKCCGLFVFLALSVTEELMQTKIKFSTNNFMQLNVTLPLLQDITMLGNYSESLDRDGSGILDIEDLADAVEEADFLPYAIVNNTGVDFEFWFPGDDVVKRSAKTIVRLLYN